MKIENMMVLWDSRGQGGKRGENIMNNRKYDGSVTHL